MTLTQLNAFVLVARLGSVRVPRLFELHALPTVWQMTSTVSSASRAGLALSEVFAGDQLATALTSSTLTVRPSS